MTMPDQKPTPGPACSCPGGEVGEFANQIIERLNTALTASQSKLTAMTKDYQKLAAWADDELGTPCEQIRHRQEVEDLRAALAAMTERCRVLEEALRPFAMMGGAYPETHDDAPGLFHVNMGDLRRAALNPTGEAPGSETTSQADVTGTFACPICGQDTPHRHSDEVVAAWRKRQINPAPFNPTGDA